MLRQSVKPSSIHDVSTSRKRERQCMIRLQRPSCSGTSTSNCSSLHQQWHQVVSARQSMERKSSAESTAQRRQQQSENNKYSRYRRVHSCEHATPANWYAAYWLNIFVRFPLFQFWSELVFQSIGKFAVKTQGPPWRRPQKCTCRI
jgi:hypothetical protein